MAKKYKFRDVYSLLQSIRNFLIGRSPHLLHNRFHPLLAPRSIPPPDIPRGPDYKYSAQYYFTRNPVDSVQPPVVAPIALGRTQSKLCGMKQSVTGMKADSDIVFPQIPTPGAAYGWDSHKYFERVPDYTPRRPGQNPHCPPPPEPPKRPRPEMETASQNDPCDPCQPKK